MASLNIFKDEQATWNYVSRLFIKVYTRLTMSLIPQSHIWVEERREKITGSIAPIREEYNEESAYLKCLKNTCYNYHRMGHKSIRYWAQPMSRWDDEVYDRSKYERRYRSSSPKDAKKTASA